MNAAINTPEQKIGFLGSFWHSIFSPHRYKSFLKASWWQVFFHLLILVGLISAALAVSMYRPIAQRLELIFQDIPAVRIENGTAQFDPALELPYIRKFAGNKIGGSKPLRYILDSGENRADLEQQFNVYILFTNDQLIVNRGVKRDTIYYSQLEGNPFFHFFFGDPLQFDNKTFPRFLAFTFVLALLFFIPLPFYIIFPLPIVLGLIFLSVAAINALLSTVALNNQYAYPQVLKVSIFAGTPAVLIMAIACFLLSGTVLLLLFALSCIIQISYILTGLQDEEANSPA